MKAAVCPRYGNPEVLEIQEQTRPIPRKSEVLIKVKASTVSSGDSRIRSANFPRGFEYLARLALGWSGPRNKVLGTELAGVVEALGPDVSRFKVGDAVIAFTGTGLGAHAEYCLRSENGPLVIKPASLSFPEAAALGFGGLTALYFLRDRARIQAGETMLIVGASGAVGVAAIQLARYFGADVTAVCSGKNADLVRSLGAQRVIDYTQTAVTSLKDSYDIVFDCTGLLSSAHQGLLKDHGRLVLIIADLGQMLEPLWKSLKNGKKVLTGNSSERVADLQFLVDLASQGSYRAVIDRSYPLLQIAEAHAYVDSGRKRGSVVVTIG